MESLTDETLPQPALTNDDSAQKKAPGAHPVLFNLIIE